MRSATMNRRLGVRLAIYLAGSYGLVLCRQSASEPNKKIVCLSCGTVYEKVQFP